MPTVPSAEMHSRRAGQTTSTCERTEEEEDVVEELDADARPARSRNALHPEQTLLVCTHLVYHLTYVSLPVVCRVNQSRLQVPRRRLSADVGRMQASVPFTLYREVAQVADGKESQGGVSAVQSRLGMRETTKNESDGDHNERRSSRGTTMPTPMFEKGSH